MRRRLVIATMIVAALAAWGADAAWAGDAGPLRSDDSSSSTVIGVAPGTGASFTAIPVRVRGDLAVQFHGDSATGCAARGLCGFSGTVVWQPPPSGTLDTVALRQHGRTGYFVSLDFSQTSFFGPPVDGGVTTADVRFSPNGSAGSSSICTDAAATGTAIQMPVHLRAASLTLAAATPSLLGTRCAGPLLSDVAGMLARRVVDVATLLNGQIGVSLASSADFAVRGLAGTVTSTVELSLGRPHTESASHGGSPKSPSFRTVTVSYRARLDGSVVTHIRGDPSSCGSLGSCGVNGTIALRVHGRPGTLELAAVTRTRRPLRDALTALGLRKDGNPRGIFALGFFTVRGRPTYAVDVVQGQTTCRDTGPLGPGAVQVVVARGRVGAEFDAAEQAPHLRCPGPIVSQTAFGTTRLGRLARHGGIIHLQTANKVRDDGYTGRTTANLALTLSHPKLKITTDARSAPSAG